MLRDSLFVESVQKYHTFFFLVDDNLLFCRAQVEDVKKIQKILAIYETASGEKKILTKLLFFSIGMFLSRQKI